MWNLDYKESWVPKNWFLLTVVLEKTLESPLDCKEIQPVHPKGDQSWIFIGRTDAEAETSILWPPDAKSWLVWKELLLGKRTTFCFSGVGFIFLLQIEGRRRRGRQRMRWLDGITNQWTWVWANSGSWWWTGRPHAVQGVAKIRTRMSDWTELSWVIVYMKERSRRNVENVKRKNSWATMLRLG